MASADQVLSTLQRARTGLPDGSVGAQDLDRQIAGRQSAMSIGQSVRSIPGAVSAAVAVPFSKPKSQAQSVLSDMPDVPAQNPTDMRLASGVQRSPMAAPGALPAAASGGAGTAADVLNSQPTQPREVVPGVFNHGRGQYSDDPSGMNMPKGFTGQPSAQNDAILQRMSDKSQAESMARVGLSQYAAEVQRAKNINADEAARNNSVGARMQRLADPFSNEGRAMRNLQMNIDSSMDRNGRPTAETAALVAQSKAMSDGYLAEPNQQRTIDAGLEREGMQQAGANARAMLSSGIDQQRVHLANSEFGLKREAQGFQTRAASRLEDLQNSYMAEQDPAKRASIVQRMRELQNKSEGNLRDNFMVVGGGQEWDAQAGVMRNVPQRLVDLRNRQEVGGMPSVGTVQRGYRFKGGDPASPASWEKA